MSPEKSPMLKSRRVMQVCLLILPLYLCNAALADDLTPAKLGDIRRLMDVTGSANIANQFASGTSQQMFKALKAARPDIPDRAMAIMEKELVKLFAEKMSASGGLLEQIVPVYHKHFTHPEIRELLAFYQTPIGRKAILVLPQVVNESMVAGQRWGQALGPEIEKRITAALRREGMLPKGK
jgi:hypothetical protein